MDFKVTAQDAATKARCGELGLRSGQVSTPAFMPVGTQASVKGMTALQLRQCGAQMILANAYHLHLRPGAEVVGAAGGIGKFMGWDGPVLTDSGGYQVFSLAALRQVSDAGVAFRSAVDGSSVFIGPSESMRIQQLLGADIAMAFDECPPYPSTSDAVAAAVARTLLWARTCRDSHTRDDQALFAIVQGGVFEELRQTCARQLVELDFEGYAIGGVSVGEPEELRVRMARFTAALLPDEKPKYLMGVGFPLDVLRGVECGMDLFDCTAPTRMGRNATAFTTDGRLLLRNSRYRNDFRAVQEGCDCLCCRVYSRAYLSYLFRAREMLGPILVTLHNLAFYLRLMSQARAAIAEGEFAGFSKAFRERYLRGKELKS